jgi:hypothetical protein
LSCASCRSTRWSASTLLSPLEVNKTYPPPLALGFFVSMFTFYGLCLCWPCHCLRGMWARPTHHMGLWFFIFVFAFLVAFVPCAVLILCVVLYRL